MLRPMPVHAGTGAARVKIGRKVYIRCADLALRLVPDADTRGAVSKLYREQNPGDFRLVGKNKGVPWGWYLPEDDWEAFARFVDNPDRQREAIDAGIRIGIARQRNAARERVSELEIALSDAQTENILLQQRIALLEAQLRAMPKPRVRVQVGRRAA